jgi:hypothetical protein
MNGIDTGAAALLASRVSTLNPVGSQGSASATQAGVSALATGTAALPDAQTSTTPQASAQTVLSAVALALDAIIRSGGEATPAVVGEAPVWSNPDADASGSAGSLPLPGVPAGAAEAADLAALEAALIADDAAALAQGADGAANLATTVAATLTGNAATADADAAAAGAAADDASSASTTGASQASAAAAAQSGPVAALAASLQQAVTGSGLFYESHLAQWLLGQRTPAALADEPQNRLIAASAQLPLDWTLASDEADDVLWNETPTPNGSNAARDGARPDGTPPSGAGYAGPGNGAGTPGTNASATAFVRANGMLAEATLLPASQDAAAGSSVHAAVIPLVRQQLDLLATGEFRWTGEAWPGVRLDWSLQQDRFDPRDGREGAGGDADEAPWRTRLTLALPTLGTVDAELTLAGETLAVRVQASSGGAARLEQGSDALRSRLEALGLALTSLAIREIGGAPASAEASKAANAYARAAAAAASQDAREARDPQAQTVATNDLDWELR